MTFKKLALVAALATSFSAFAADSVGVIPTGDAYTVAAATPLLQAEFSATAATVDGNQAYVVQEGAGSVAYINQATDAASFAAIAQQDNGALAVVYQSGAQGNKALIVTRGAPDVALDAASYDVASVDTADKMIAAAKGALSGTAAVMSADANVALINQTSDGGFNVAYIDQNASGGTVNGNFAAIVQTAGAFNNLGLISQTGSKNQALIVQAN